VIQSEPETVCRLSGENRVRVPPPRQASAIGGSHDVHTISCCMMPLHHPSEATLLVYAAGGLSEGMALVVAGHLGYCESCWETIAAAEAVGGVLLDEIQPEAVSAQARSSVVARLDQEPSVENAPRLQVGLTEFIAGQEAGGRWSWLSPGVRHLLMSSELRLVRAAPGRSLPIHGHVGSELTLVLGGAYSDELGRFGMGDVAELDEDMVHRPRADPDEGCLCLLASEGPFKPTGWLAQRVLRWSALVSPRSATGPARH
jgi:putative transcriptional regulator